VAGVRCPQTYPYGPIAPGAISALIAAKRISSAVYKHNYRVVTLLVGEHSGKSTAPAERGLTPYRVDGVRMVRVRRHG